MSSVRKPLLLLVERNGGRLGNQMFVRAYVLGKRAQGVRIVFNDPEYPLGPRRAIEEMMQSTFENLYHAFPNLAREKPNVVRRLIELACKGAHEIKENEVDLDVRYPVCRVHGYFMWEKHFEHIEDEIRRVFSFNESDPVLAKAIRRIEEDSHSVAIHVRLTDYLSKRIEPVYNEICTPEYYQGAMDYLREQVGEDIHFYTFSDDMKTCEELLGLSNPLLDELKASPNYCDWWDMCLMSHAHHNIIANSSFSWWGAWLNTHKGKTVICPERWDNLNQLRSGTDRICAKGWTAIDARGGVLT